MFLEKGNERVQVGRILEEIMGSPQSADVVEQCVQTYQAFERFVKEAGGALLQMESIAIISFLGWVGRSRAIVGKEVEHYDALRQSVRNATEGNSFHLTSEVRTCFQHLIEHWIGGSNVPSTTTAAREETTSEGGDESERA